MLKIAPAEAGQTAGSPPYLAAFGLWLKRHQHMIRRLQWGVVMVYAMLLIVPAMLPLPGRTAHIWNNATIFAQFIFWGIWWPGVLISMLLAGRLWCGLLCPEGALSAFAARHGRGRATPRWIRWPGWPFSAFVLTTLYGQLASVYQYPGPVLVILGGSTLGAMAVGYLYGRNKRIWCRYLCPVNGVFALLSKLAPMHYTVDHAAWNACPSQVAQAEPFNCEPIVPVRTMVSTSPCHMCGRCAGFRGAVTLSARAPNREIVEISGRTATCCDSLLIIVGMIGVAIGAFQWASSPWFVTIKQAIALRLITANVIWPLDTSLPWWLLTNYPAQNDVLSLLDGTTLLLYIAAATVVLSLAVGLPVALATRINGAWRWQRFHHLTHALIPLAAAGIILGLSAQTVMLLRADGLALGWVTPVRIIVLCGASLWSVWLAWRILRRDSPHGLRTALATASFITSIVAPVWAWVLLFWIW